MNISGCSGCRYLQKRYNRDRYGNLMDGYNSCHYPPYWGKHIETIGTCPKDIDWQRGK